MARVVIIGAGLTGLSTAYHLEQLGFSDFALFEKERTVGGLCRSVEQNGFTFDYTGHLLHSNDTYFSEFLKTVVGFEHFNTIDRKSYIYSHNTYTHFPFQSNLYGLPTEVIIECIEGFITRPLKEKKNETFHQWALRKFGAGIVKHFFASYQEKIFAHPLDKLTASWTGRFVPDTSLQEIIKGALQEPQYKSTTGYNAQFLYPKKGGINFWITKLAQAIQKPIKTNYCVESIDTKNKIITFTNGDFEKYEILVNTMPLNTFLQITKESAAHSMRKASQYLLCNSVANFNLGVQSEDLSKKHWIYLPEKQFPHYRIGFYHNFSKEMAPAGCASVYGEYAYLNRSSVEIKKTIQEAIKSTRTLLNISDAQVVTERVIYISHAYVIFDFWREKYLPKIHTTLNAQSIYSIGRYGAWKYSSMQEAVLDGKAMAEKIQGESHEALQKQKNLSNRRSRIYRITSG